MTTTAQHGAVGDIHPTAQRILDATIAAIEADGESAVRLADIAESLNMTVPAMYRYFADRDALINAAHAQRVSYFAVMANDMMSAWIASLTTRQQMIDGIDDLVDLMISPVRSDELFMYTEVLAKVRYSPELALAIDTVRNHNKAVLTELIAQAQQHGWIVPDLNIGRVVELVYTLSVGQLAWYLGPEPHDVSRYRTAIADLLRHYLFGLDTRPLGVTSALPAMR